MSFSTSIPSVKFSQNITINPAPIPANSIRVETFSVPGVFPDMVPIYNWFFPQGDAPVRILNLRIPVRDTIELVLWNFGNVTENIPEISLLLVGV